MNAAAIKEHLSMLMDLEKEIYKIKLLHRWNTSFQDYQIIVST